MGEVFLADDTRLERKAAIEFLPVEMAADLERRHHDLLIAEILFREAEALINGKAEPDTTDPAASPASATGDKAPPEKRSDSDSSGTGNEK